MHVYTTSSVRYLLKILDAHLYCVAVFKYVKLKKIKNLKQFKTQFFVLIYFCSLEGLHMLNDYDLQHNNYGAN